MNARLSQQEESQQTREVRFSDSPEEVVPGDNSPTGNPDEIWYSVAEVRNLLLEYRAEILRIRNALALAPNAHVTDDDRIEMRGLEGYISPAVAQGIRQNRNAHRHSVLGEHDRQAALGIDEADMLYRISERNSRPAREAAYQLALRFSNIS